MARFVIDTNMLIFLFDQNSENDNGQSNGEIINSKERIERLISELSTKGDTLIIPTPVLAELLEKSGSALSSWLAIIDENPGIEIVDFDKRAAIECAILRQKRNELNIPKSETGAKIKFDELIIAAALSAEASVIYSSDKNMKAKATQPRH